LRTDDGVRKLCVERASASEIRHYALKHGLTTLRQCGWEKVLAGITDVDEVKRVTKGDVEHMGERGLSLLEQQHDESESG